MQREEEWGMNASGYRVSFWNDENVQEFIVVMAVQLCECTKSHWIVHNQWVNCGHVDCISIKLLFKKNYTLLLLLPSHATPCLSLESSATGSLVTFSFKSYYHPKWLSHPHRWPTILHPSAVLGSSDPQLLSTRPSALDLVVTYSTQPPHSLPLWNNAVTRLSQNTAFSTWVVSLSSSNYNLALVSTGSSSSSATLPSLFLLYQHPNLPPTQKLPAFIVTASLVWPEFHASSV